jgi:hypothetical protein
MAFESDTLPAKTEANIIFNTNTGHHHDGSDSRAILRYKTNSTATERTTSSATYADTLTAWTFTFPANSVIIGYRVEADIHSSSTYFAGLRFKFVGSALGTQYLANQNSVANPTTQDNEPVMDADHADTADLLAQSGAGYNTVPNAKSGLLMLPITDTSIVVTAQIRSSNASGMTAAKNISLTLFYTDGIKAD